VLALDFEPLARERLGEISRQHRLVFNDEQRRHRREL